MTHMDKMGVTETVSIQKPKNRKSKTEANKAKKSLEPKKEAALPFPLPS